MTDASPRHPEDHVMAAFIEGKLAPDEIAVVADHLRGCADCRTVVSETARLEREEQRGEPAGTRWWLWAAAAAMVVLVVAAVPVLRWNARRSSPIAQLIAAAPRQHRQLEARLSGFPWARLQAPPRGRVAHDPADLKLIGVAGNVLEQTSDARTPEARHARGVADLLSGNAPEAISTLEQAANASDDARVWNDLAAARYSVAMAEDRPVLLPHALAAADRALKLDAKFAEAHFNRALILERLGIRNEARTAWQSYLSIDPGGEWSAEAREHLRSLEEHSQHFDPSLLHTTSAAELARRFPQETRLYGEGPLLAEWAEAEAKHDRDGASSRLSLARAVGVALAASNGEHLLADSVAVIDAASDSARKEIADAHLLYRDGRLAYNKRDAGAAEAAFVRAAALFRAARSPMADVAAHYAALSVFAQHRGSEAFSALSRLRSTIDRTRHPALAAYVEWSLALTANADGDWGAGARAADTAASMYRSLGETQNAAILDGIAADALDMAGGADAAWSRRIRTFAALTGTRECARFLRTAAMILDRFGHTGAAIAMIGPAIDDLRDDPAQRAAALTDRAKYADRENDAAAAHLALDGARSAAAAVRDAAMRELLGASIDVTDAAVRRRTEPQATLVELDRAVTFFATGRLRHLLPDAYLQRARSHRAAGDDAAAAADYAAALREVETQRRTIGDADLRLRFLDTAAEIVDETVELHLARGSVEEAFRVADGMRDLLDAPTASPASANSPAALPATVVIEYVVLPHAIAIFCRTGEQMTVEKVAVERTSLAPRLALFAEKVRRRAPVEEIRSEAAALYRLLIAPVEPRLAHADRIVIIPDRQLYAVPFATLWDESRRAYLVERFAMHFAATAASAAEVAEPLQPAAVFTDPPTPQWPRLPAGRAEGERIAALYGTKAISGEAATRARFLDAARESALIHYAGHADSDAGSYGALLLAAGRGDSGVLASSEIARFTLQRHPLVVLAACGTFRGDPIHIAGMSSLSRAFLLAGARAVVGTLWEIDDDVAAPLFLEFHERLRAGASPASALRAAQLAMIHAPNARLQHPATWAPVEVTEQSIGRTPWTQPQSFTSSAWSFSPRK